MFCITENILMPQGSKRACPVQWGTAHSYLSASSCGKTLLLTDSSQSKISTCLTPNMLLATHSLFPPKQKTHTQFRLTEDSLMVCTMRFTPHCLNQPKGNKWGASHQQRLRLHPHAACCGRKGRPWCAAEFSGFSPTVFHTPIQSCGIVLLNPSEWFLSLQWLGDK